MLFKKAYFANQEILKIYLGNDLIYANSSTPTEPTEPTYTLNSLPNGVTDTIDGNIITRNVGVLTLDGSQTFLAAPSANDINTLRFYTFFDGMVKKGQDNTTVNLKCEDFPCTTWNLLKDGDDEGLSTYSGDSRINIRINKSKANSVNAIKTYLSEHPLTIYYELATSYTETI